MKYVLIGIGILMSISVYIVINDYFYRKKLSKKIKIGDKKRIFTENETTFYHVTVIDIYTENKKRLAKCKNEFGEIEIIPLMDLIY